MNGVMYLVSCYPDPRLMQQAYGRHDNTVIAGPQDVQLYP